MLSEHFLRWQVYRLPASGWFISCVAIAIFQTALGAAPAISLPPGNYQPPRAEAFDRADRVQSLRKEIHQIYEDHARTQHFPGAAWGVVLDGQLVITGSHGWSDVQAKIPASPRTVFRIASMTKSVTAMAIMKLRDGGKLRLDDPVQHFLPEFKKLRTLTSDAPSISLRHLLTHGAGFPEDNPWGDRQLDDTDRDLVELIRRGLFFSTPPGTAFEYSNLGFALLGRVITKVSGMPCQRYIDREILSPLGMRNTAWDFKKVPAETLAKGYRWEEDVWKEELPLGDGSYAAMGGMLSSVEDFARYVALHTQAWPSRDESNSGPLRRASLREMHHPWRISQFSPQNTNSNGSPCPTVAAYGYGLAWTMDCEQRIRVSHSGGLPGYGSQWVFLPEYGLGLVALANRTYAGWSAPNRRVIELLLERGGLKPRTLPASPILQARRDELARILPSWEGATAGRLFAENFFPDNPLHLLKAKSRELFERAGVVTNISGLRPENQLRGTFSFEGERGSVETFFTLTPENPPLIQELRMKFIPRP